MSVTEITEITLGNMVTLSTTVELRDPLTGALTATSDPGLALYVTDPDGVETIYRSTTTPAVTEGDTGSYYLEFLPGKLGQWRWRWLGDSQAQGASEGVFNVVSIYVPDTMPPDLTDLAVFIPWARRACEGPFGPPQGLPRLNDDQIYAMIADACAEIILFSGSLFGHPLNVAERDPRLGFPTRWTTDVALDQWEGALVICQVALDYYFHVFRDMRTSEHIVSEGTEWEYTLSANVIRSYVQSLQDQRDLALKGLRDHHPIIDRYASNIRVRDQATVAMLEWWDDISPGVGGAGFPGGQEAAVIPWTPGWSGGWSP